MHRILNIIIISYFIVTNIQVYNYTDNLKSYISFVSKNTGRKLKHVLPLSFNPSFFLFYVSLSVSISFYELVFVFFSFFFFLACSVFSFVIIVTSFPYVYHVANIQPFIFILFSHSSFLPYHTLSPLVFTLLSDGLGTNFFKKKIEK